MKVAFPIEADPVFEDYEGKWLYDEQDEEEAGSPQKKDAEAISFQGKN